MSSGSAGSFFGIISAIVVVAVIVLLVRTLRRSHVLHRMKEGGVHVLCAVLGAVALVGGGLGYFVADGKLNDPEFWWEQFGDSQYEFMIDLRNIGRYAMIVGVLLIVVAVALYAVNASKRNAGADRAVPAPARKTPVQPQQETIRYCAKCHQPLTTGGNFCPHCGSETALAERRCVCGALLDESANFCPECGTKYEP